MGYVMEKKSRHRTRQLQGEVPEPLVRAFDEATDRLGMNKKRVLAAAVHAFLGAAEGDQYEMCRRAYLAYYANDAEAAAAEGGGPAGGRQGPADCRSDR